MPKKAKKSRSISTSKTGRGWIDPDDAPEITQEMLDRAEIIKDGKIVRRGRPPLGNLAKQSVTLRLDAAVVDAYRATGEGWQSRINTDLIKTAKRLKA